jgi:hypothetical protein
MSGFDRLELLRIDIEGSEAEIFSQDCESWLPLVRAITIELHGDQCREMFFKALAPYQYEHSVSGEFDTLRGIKRRTESSRGAF